MNVLADDWLYADVAGRPEALSLEEARKAVGKGRGAPLKVSFIDCEINRIHVGEDAIADKETLIGEAFSNGYIVQEEQLPGHIIQVIGARQEKIKEVAECFKPASVDTLVPYPVALRAFLRNRNLLREGRCIVFIDDLKTQAIVTILSGMHCTAPRRLSARDAAHLGAEVRRSQQSYAANHDMQGESSNGFVLVSNNKEWLDALKADGAGTHDEYVHLDVQLPVLEGLRVAKFGMHFCLPAEQAERRRKELWSRRWRSIAGIVLAGGVCAGCYAAAWMHQQQVQHQWDQVRQEEHRMMHEMEIAYRQKFVARLRTVKRPDYAGLFYAFASQVPYGFAVKEFGVLQTGEGAWVAQGAIYPMDRGLVYQEFPRHGRFREARVARAQVNKLPGQTITLTLTQDDL